MLVESARKEFYHNEDCYRLRSSVGMKRLMFVENRFVCHFAFLFIDVHTETIGILYHRRAAQPNFPPSSNQTEDEEMWLINFMDDISIVANVYLEIVLVSP